MAEIGYMQDGTLINGHFNYGLESRTFQHDKGSRILKDCSKPWQGTARARIPTCFMAESRIFRNLLSAMKHVGISSGSSLPRLRAVLQDPTC